MGLTVAGVDVVGADGGPDMGALGIAVTKATETPAHLGSWGLHRWHSDWLDLGSAMQCAHGNPRSGGGDVHTCRRDQRPNPIGNRVVSIARGDQGLHPDRNDGWTEVELDNGNVGWLPNNAIADV